MKKFAPPHITDAFGGNEEEALKAIHQQNSIWRFGRDIFGEKKGAVAIQDAVALPNASIVVPHVLTQIVKEGIEPMMIGSSLLTRIPYQRGLQIQFPATGTLYAEDLAPGQSHPEFSPDLGGQVTNEMKVGKSGLAIKLFDDIIENSAYNLVAYWLRQAGAALQRHKEQKIFNFITRMGMVVFDNAARTSGISGKLTSGRNADGTLNGSMTMDDIMEMYATGLQQGFMMDTILVHPLTWLMWLRDPVLRTFQLQYGGGTWFNMWQGDPRNRNDLASFAPLGEGQGQNINPPGGAATPLTPLTDYDQRINSRPTLPNYLGLSFNIIVSPFVPFDITTNRATMIMFQAGQLGALIEKRAPRMLEWSDPILGLRKMIMEEEYGLAVVQEGQGVLVAKSISSARNYISDESVTPTLSVSGNIQSQTSASSV